MEFRSYILTGIRYGFRNRELRCEPASTNLHSALENAAVVWDYLSKEVSLRRVIGPIHPAVLPAGTQVSPFGVIPKSSQPGKWRLIVDLLSSPTNKSVNDGIDPELCSMHYLRLDEVLEAVVRCGRGSFLAIESAYRMVPVHPQDRPLLAMQWVGQVFFDTRLPFGLRSALKIFTAVADTLQWVFKKHGVTWVEHYLDDYITIGPPDLGACERNLEVMLAVCRWLAVPVAPAKCAGPATVIVFLGFELDTNQLVVRLPEEQLQRIGSLVKEWVARKACKKRELESLLGHLQHAATVIRPGQTFVHRLIELVGSFGPRDHWVRLSESSRSNLVWWLTFMECWNGISLMPSGLQVPVPVVSDASGTWGCGAH